MDIDTGSTTGNVQTDKETQETRELLSEVRDRFEASFNAEKENREMMLNDIDFLDGNQWDPEIKKEREMQNRPCMTINDLPTFVDQVVGDQRKSRPSIKVRPRGRATTIGKIEPTPEFKNVNGDKKYSLAEAYNGMIRSIQEQGNADQAYDTAFEHQASHGLGYFQIITDYVDDDVFEQDIGFAKISNSFSVYYDPIMYEEGPEAANYCFKSEFRKKSEFKREYPNAMQADMPEGMGEEYAHWWEDDNIRIVGYFKKVKEKRTIRLLSDGRVVDPDKFEQIEDELADQGITVVKSREVDATKVVWYKVTANEILEGPMDFPSKFLPIVPAIGKELNVRGRVKLRGLVRFAKEPARMYNYWRTASTETVALQPKAPWVGDPEGTEGNEKIWKNANNKLYSFLPYNTKGGKLPYPQRQAPPTMSSAMVTEALRSQDDKKAAMGMFNASLGEQGNETSGRAILARQKEGDVGTFAFQDNFSRSLRYAGMILVDLIPKIYDTERLMRIVLDDGKEDFIKINETIIDEETKEPVVLNDLSVSRMDIVVDTGPSYTTQRMEAADSMMAFVQAFPQAAPLIGDLLAKNFDWPGADEIARRLEALVPPEARQGNEEDGEQNPIPTPEQIAQLIQEAIQSEGLDVERMKREAEQIMAMAKKMEAQAKLNESEEKAALTTEVVANMIQASIAQLLEQMASGGFDISQASTPN